MARNSSYKLNTSLYGTHRIIASLLGRGNKILDIGCNRGYLTQLAPDNRYFGVDVDDKCLVEASRAGYITKLVDLEQIKDSSFFDQRFDIIIFADVLEHLKDPKSSGFRIIDQNLELDGKVVISLPNVAHLSIRLSLLLGRFDYQDAGILDRTHLHLYTCKSAQGLAHEMGLDVISILYSSDRFGGIIRRFPILGQFLGYNIIMLCKRY